MEPKKVLELVASIIDGTLYEYDDGFLIEVSNPTLWMKQEEGAVPAPWRGNQAAGDLVSVSGVKFLFDVDGKFETVQYHGARA